MRDHLTVTDSMPRPFGVGAVLIVAGLFFVLAVFRHDTVGYRSDGLAVYGLAALYLAALVWRESTGGALLPNTLPPWMSPPALVAGWTLAWIYAPAAASFFDDRLIDDLTQAQGGEAVLVTGILLACLALTVLSITYHSARGILGPRALTGEPVRHVPVQRAVGLYLVSAAARTLRVLVLGIAFGADTTTGWGSLQFADQWIGYLEDLRYLALVVLVAHVARRGTGHVWVGVALACEILFAATSGFIKPFIWPVVVCVATVALLDRLRVRHVAMMLPAVLLAAAFVSVAAVVREDRTGAIGTNYTSGMSSAIAAASHWQGAAAELERSYWKFFGRQTEVAGSTGLVVALTPGTIPFEGLREFAMLPTKLIPRAVWPDKPILSRGQWFSVNYRGLDEATTSSSAMTMFAEGYLFYGWTGVAMAMMILGAVFAGLYRRLDNPTFALVYLALLPTILEIEPELSSYLTSLVQRSVVFIIVFSVLLHRREHPAALLGCHRS